MSILKPINIESAENGVKVTIVSITGKSNSMELPVSAERLQAFYDSDVLIQDFFHDLNEDQREFLITGLLPGEWDDLFQEEE